MATIGEISKDLEKFIVFVTSLSQYSDDVLTEQINVSWSIQDIISHIMGWNINFTITTVSQILNSERVMLEEHPDVQAINDASVSYGKAMKPHDLLAEAIYHRRQLIAQLNLISESAFSKYFHNNDSYTLESFLQEMFISHDLHHKEQIMRYLSKKSQLDNPRI
ncbi:DinB family protein [Paenibacillus sp. 1_12]|uniref:DinB family protein n=1 Tax=Paenibacillus sp. 1_12 TaxID=1566278 RepID=UPI000B847948|nr:DinB family protein [Paenibacillus sp. 1_12]